MKTFPKWIYWMNIIVFLASVIFIVVVFWVDKSYVLDTVYICLSFMIGTVGVSIFWYITALFNLCFEDAEIKVRWGKFTYKRVPYSKIQGISIEGAIYYKYRRPVLDERKKQKSVIVLYESDVSFLHRVSSNSGQTLPFPIDALCGDFLSVENLKILLDKTGLPIYITEKMLVTHQSALNEVLASSSSRFIVAHYDKKHGVEKKSTYDQFVYLTNRTF